MKPKIRMRVTSVRNTRPARPRLGLAFGALGLAAFAFNNGPRSDRQGAQLGRARAILEPRPRVAHQPSKVETILTELEAEAGRPPLADHQDDIERLFAGSTVEAIFQALADADSEWARAQLATLRTKSPQTLKVAHRQHYTTRTEARIKISTWITDFYNTTRRHSANDGLAPIKFEHQIAEARRTSTAQLRAEVA